MRWSILGTIAVPLLLSGCIFGHCGPSSSATWVEPGLFDAVVARGATVEDPGPGIPFDVEVLNASWGPATLQRIDAPPVPSGSVNETDFERGEHWPAELRVALVAPGADRYLSDDAGPRNAANPYVTVTTMEVPPSEVRAAAEALLTPLGIEPDEAWFDELAMQRDEVGRHAYRGGLERSVYQYWNEVEGAPDTAALVRDLDPRNASQEFRVYPEDATVTWPDGWRMSFHVAVARTTLDGDPALDLVVNAADVAMVEMPDAHDDNETSGRAWVVETFAANDLPTPRVRDWQWGTTIC